LAKRTRSSSPHDLVHFKKPPVGEVALTFQFAGEAVDLDVLARFASEVRGKLPRVERQPVAPPMHETFDATPVEQIFQVTLDQLPRTWLLSEDGARLVQLQADRISYNWRRLDSQRYPRYSTLRREFRGYVSLLGDLLKATGRRMPAVNLCEVHYVNHVPAGPGSGGGHAELAQFVNRLRARPPRAYLPHVEDSQFNARWRIPASALGKDEGGRPVGRLLFTAGPGLKPPAFEPIYVINLVGRVIPLSQALTDAWKALDVAHEWVVLGFKDLTTPRMHKEWGLEETGRRAK
jgi:uncharacterized protein (TIGR04255 family)